MGLPSSLAANFIFVCISLYRCHKVAKSWVVVSHTYWAGEIYSGLLWMGVNQFFIFYYPWYLNFVQTSTTLPMPVVQILVM